MRAALILFPMPDTSSRSRSYIAPWLVLAAWTVPALLSTLETLMFSRLADQPIELWRAFLSEAPGWYVWAAFTPLIVRLAERAPLTKRLRWQVLGAHLAAYLIVALSASAVWAGLGLWLRPGRFGFLASLRNWFVAGLPFTVVVYAAVVGIFYGIVARARLREQERDAARLAQELSEAQLASLRMQLQPHFLFNSLNAIMALVRDGENARAVDAVSLLGDMLRATLRAGPAHEVALVEELTFTRRYLELEQLRFGERLRVTFDVPATLLDAAVPLFVLQPFVENAIKHGILGRRRGGAIAIAATTDGSTLTLRVSDDGVGLVIDWDAGGTEGVGLRNARTRLGHLYGAAGTLRVGCNAGGEGALVEVTLPLRRVPVAAVTPDAALHPLGT